MREHVTRHHGIRVYRVSANGTDLWFADGKAAKASAKQLAEDLVQEVRVITCWLHADRIAILNLLNGGKPEARRTSIHYIAKPREAPTHQKVLA